MRAMLIILSLLYAAATAIGGAESQNDGLLARARALHQQVPLIDGHNDYPWEVRQKAGGDFRKLDISKAQPAIMTDIGRLRAGGVGGQFWSVYVPADIASPVSATLEQIDIVHRMVGEYPETFELALTADDVDRIFKKGKIASLIGMEGGHSIDSSPGALRMFYRLGARYLTLTHSRNTAWADSATDTPKSGGLSALGEQIVREMNRLGMLVDLSHTSSETMDDALRVTAAPVIFSHSSARGVVDVPRNVPDAILRRLPQNGGVVMVTFVPDFVSNAVAAHSRMRTAEQARLRGLYPTDARAVQTGMTAWLNMNPPPRATLAQVADHIDHIRNVAGIDYIGLGGDFDGITTVPLGLEDVSTYPALTAELLRRGYREDDVKKILGLNLLRVMRAAEKTASLLLLAETASAAPCTTATAACTEWITVAGARARSLVYRSYPLEARNEAITRGLIIVHGAGRDADTYFRHMLAAAFLAGALENTIVISPRFASNDGGDCRDALAPRELNWTCVGPDTWRSGGTAMDDGTITSFDMADEILRKLARKDLFPNLRAIVVAGHSAGGQFVTRYEMANQVHGRLGVPITYVVANPSSYAYLDSLRPTRSAVPATVAAAAPGYIPPVASKPPAPFVSFSDARNCTAYDHWPYGLQNRTGYSARLTDDELKKRLATRRTTYLLGELDILPLYGFDGSCSAMAQGPTRLARGLAFGKYVNEKYGAQHKTLVVPACGHSARCMFTAEPALPLIFPKEQGKLNEPTSPSP